MGWLAEQEGDLRATRPRLVSICRLRLASRGAGRAELCCVPDGPAGHAMLPHGDLVSTFAAVSSFVFCVCCVPSGERCLGVNCKYILKKRGQRIHSPKAAHRRPPVAWTRTAGPSRTAADAERDAICDV